LTIAGSLWKLAHEESFVDYLKQMKESKNATLKRAHIRQILWLKDERTIDLLIDILEDDDGFVRFLALKMLNELEFGRTCLLCGMTELPHQSSYYEQRRNDEALHQRMVANISRFVPS